MQLSGPDGLHQMLCWVNQLLAEQNYNVCMRPFPMETAAILVHSFSLCTKAVHQNGRRGSCQDVVML